jgi:hypothetical protein
VSTPDREPGTDAPDRDRAALERAEQELAELERDLSRVEGSEEPHGG